MRIAKAKMLCNWLCQWMIVIKMLIKGFFRTRAMTQIHPFAATVGCIPLLN